MDKSKAIRSSIEIISNNKANAVQETTGLRVDPKKTKRETQSLGAHQYGARLSDQLQDVLGNAASLCHDR